MSVVGYPLVYFPHLRQKDSSSKYQISKSPLKLFFFLLNTKVTGEEGPGFNFNFCSGVYVNPYFNRTFILLLIGSP